MSYREATAARADLVCCFWELATGAPLPENFQYIVLPDACVDLVFDLRRGEAVVMTPHITSQKIELGTDFRYVGIRLWPGVYRGELTQIIGGTLDIDELAGEKVSLVAARLLELTFAQQQAELAAMVERLAASGLLKNDAFTMQFIEFASKLHSVNDVARRLKMSERQLRRRVRQATGFSPRELLKIVNFQRTFAGDWTEIYADQSHYIHSFRQITRRWALM